MCLGQAFLARLAEEYDAVELDHDVACERGGERDRGGGDRDQHVQIGLRQIGREQEGLQQQPFGDEAVQRRQSRDRQRAHQREPGDPGHAMDQPAEFAQRALARGMQHRAGGEEQQALEVGVVDAVVERGGERERSQGAHAVGLEDDGESDADQDEADVLDRGIGEQALHVALHRGKHHAVECGGEAQHQDHHAPPPHLHVQQVEQHAQQAVDRGLQHHCGHQRRHRRGRGRVRLGQPHVQRQHAGLGAEAEQRQRERDRGPERRELHRAHGVEGIVAGAVQHAEAQQDADGADVGDQQVEEAGAPDFGLGVVAGDEEIRRQRHGLPEHHEGVGVVGEQHQRHAGDEHVVIQALQPGRRAFAAAEVTGREQRDARGHRAQQQQEKCGQRVQAQVERQPGQTQRQHQGLRLAAERIQRGRGQDQCAQCACRKQQTAHQIQIVRKQHAGQSEREPQQDHVQDQMHGRGRQGHYLTFIPGCAPLSGASR